MQRNTTDTARVKVVAITRVIPSREFRTVELEPLPGERVASLCARAFPRFHATRYALDGRNCEPGSEASGGSVAVCWSVPQADGGVLGVLAFVGKVLLASAISMALSYAVNALTAKKAKKQKYNKQTEDLSDEQYGWNYDAANAVQEGAPIPVLYGRRMVLPPIIQQRTYTANRSELSFAELVYAVADAGGGFDDVVSYPVDSDGNIQALLDHTSWRNYNSAGTGGVAVRNYARGQTAYYNGDYNGSAISGTAISTLTDGSTSTEVKQNFKNIVLQTQSPVMPTKCCVFSKVGAAFAGVSSISLYGYDSRWRLLMTTSKFVKSSGSVWVCQAGVDGQPTASLYQVFRIVINGWKWDSEQSSHPSTPEKNICEVQLFAEMSGSVPGGFCAVEVSTGALGQAPPMLTENIFSGLNVQKKLDINEFIFSTTPLATPDRLAVHIEFPYGLYSIDNTTGDYESKPVKILAQFRTVAQDGTRGAWQHFFTNSHASSQIQVNTTTGVLTVLKISQQPLKLSFERDGLSTGDHYEVQMSLAEDPAPGQNEECTTVWTAIDEGWSIGCAYTRTATATLKLLASETLNGDIPQFKVLAERGLVNVFNSIDGEWQPKPADNPAWVAYDILCNPKFDDSRYGDTEESEEGEIIDIGTHLNDSGVFLREQFQHRKLIYSEFAAWAEFCDELGITCSMYFDSSTTVEKALGYVCDIGRAQLVNRGGTIGVAIDRADTPVYVFDEFNMLADSWSVSYMDRTQSPTEVEVTFFDREREWQRFTVTARDPAKDVEGVSQNTDSVTLYACDRRDVAQAYAQYLLERSMVRRTFKWTGDFDSMPCDIGDVVMVLGNPARIISATFDDEHRRVFEAEEYVAARYTTAAYPSAGE